MGPTSAAPASCGVGGVGAYVGTIGCRSVSTTSIAAPATITAAASARTTFVVAGSGEVDRLNADTIVRRGETSPDAIREKAVFVMRVMHTRLRALGADWPDVTTIDVYTPHPIEPFVKDIILRTAGAAA